MGNLAYGYWVLTEITTAVFLLRGLSGWVEVSGFLCSHAAAVGLTHWIFLALVGGQRPLRQKVVTRDFQVFLVAVSIVPVFGPASVLFLCLFLRFYPIYPVRYESFEKVNRDILLVYQKRFEGRTLPITEALLIRGLTRTTSMRLLGVLDEMAWSATKSALLKYVIRLSPFQSVVLMAIDMLTKRMDQILGEAAKLEESEKPDLPACSRLAHLYHEFCFLDLCEPAMKPFYRQKACEHALHAFERSDSEDDALLCVKYLLEADRVEEARTLYDRFRQRGDYFFPKWITYEFELSLRQRDMEAFTNLYLLIETGGGVFIPEKVKEAAKAWNTVLTSAWL